MTDAEKIAWCAGLFDGEGCICTSGRVALSLSMTDEDVVRRFHEWMGAGQVYRYKRRPPYDIKPVWAWNCNGKTAAVRCLNLLVPYFGIRRAAKAREALSLLAQITGQDEREKMRGLARGVYRRGARFIAFRRKRYLGVFLTEDEAAEAYRKAEAC